MLILYISGLKIFWKFQQKAKIPDDNFSPCKLIIIKFIIKSEMWDSLLYC